MSGNPWNNTTVPLASRGPASPAVSRYATSRSSTRIVRVRVSVLASGVGINALGALGRSLRTLSGQIDHRDRSLRTVAHGQPGPVHGGAGDLVHDRNAEPHLVDVEDVRGERPASVVTLAAIWVDPDPNPHRSPPLMASGSGPTPCHTVDA